MADYERLRMRTCRWLCMNFSAMRLSKVIVLGFALTLLCGTALAQNNVSDYLRDGWEVKAVTQISAVGYTQIILQKGPNGVICTMYYSVKENSWTGVGACRPLP